MSKKKWLAILLAGAMLLPAAAGMISCGSEEHKAENSTNKTLSAVPVTSARAVDLGDMTYYLDEAGDLYTVYGDHITQMAELNATQICIAGELLWYASGDSLYTYQIASGEQSLYAQKESEITTFAICGQSVYYLCQDKLLCGDEVLIDLSAKQTADGYSLASVCDFALENADSILLYLPNPHYQDEDAVEGYLLSQHNDTYITYQYTLSTGLLKAYDDTKDRPGTLASQSEGISINGWTLPFNDYPVGTYFTYNGKACTCHNRGACVANNLSGENCLRYWPSRSNRQVDLRGVQCMGFARFCQWRLFGTHDKEAPGDFYNAFGKKLSAGSWTANTVKNTFTKVGPGGHIRTGAGHSLFVISVSASGFITYECNTSNKDCLIYTRQWTWDTFYSYAGSRDLLYYNMPYDFDGSGSVTPEDDYEIGTYQITANGGLNMRAEPSTSSAVLVTIPNNTIVQVTAVQKVGSYYWGYTSYEGKSGWIRLDYAIHQSATVKGIEITALPSKTTYTVGDQFTADGMVVQAKFTDGTAFEIAGYTCSGYNMQKAGSYTVKVTYGSFSDSFTITVKEKDIPPTSISLERSELTLIVGDTYEMSYTLLPADTTQKTITWASSDRSAVTVEDGVIKATAIGASTVTATTQNGLTVGCRVTVIKMPTGVNWSVTAEGKPLTSLPNGIEPVDYSIRYRLPQGAGWGDWIYDNIPAGLTGYQCQFRAFTATFVNTLDGQTVELFTVEFNQVINLSKYSLEREGYLFTGWYYDPRSAESHDPDYAAPSKITISEDLLLYAGWIPLGKIAKDGGDPFGNAALVDSFGFAGVELRVAGDATGLRYISRISTALIAQLESVHKSNQSLQPSKATDTGIGFGTVVRMRGNSSAPLVKSDASYLFQGGTVTVPAQRTHATYNGYILFNAFVCGYTADYYKTQFIARPYLTYSDANGILHTHYFTVTGDSTQGGGYYTSLFAEAEKMVADPATDPITRKWLEDTIL